MAADGERPSRQFVQVSTPTGEDGEGGRGRERERERECVRESVRETPTARVPPGSSSRSPARAVGIISLNRSPFQNLLCPNAFLLFNTENGQIVLSAMDADGQRPTRQFVQVSTPTLLLLYYSQA